MSNPQTDKTLPAAPTSAVLGYVAFGACLLISFWASGVVVGWNSLLLMLKDEHVYLRLCDHGASSCDAQDVRLNYVFTAGFFAMFVSRFFMGAFLDVHGPLKCMLLGLAITLAGSLLFAFSDDENFDAYIPGYLLIGFGGSGVHLSCFHFTNLFPGKESTAASACSAVFSGSSAVFLIFRLTGGSVRETFLGYCVLLLCFVLLALLVQPHSTIPKGSALQLSAAHCWPRVTLVPPVAPVVLPTVVVTVKEDEFEETPQPSTATGLSALPFQKQACTSEYWGQLLWFSALLLTLQFYIATANDQLERKGADYEAYAEMLTLIMAFGFVALPVVGGVLDRLGFVVGTVCVTTLYMLAGVMNLTVGSLEPQILTFVLIAVARFGMFATFFSYLPATFGFATFGKVVGSISVFAALVGLSQQFITVVALEHFDAVNGGFLALVVATYAYSAWLYRRGQRTGETQAEEALEEPGSKESNKLAKDGQALEVETNPDRSAVVV